MQYVHFIGGRNSSKKLISVHFGTSKDPEASLATLESMSPLGLTLLGLEEGGAEKLEEVKERFKKAHYKGPWYRATDELIGYIEALEPVDRDAGKTKRVSVDLVAEDFVLLEQLVETMGLKSKADFFRRALHIYAGLQGYKDQGYLIQAVRGGRMVQFPDLSLIEKP